MVMSFLGFIIGTAILWLLTAVIVNPLANFWTQKKLKQESIPVPKNANEIEILDEGAKKKMQSFFTRNYILADILVLGIAGFLLGIISGNFFLGISFERRSWPGILVFITSSIAGSLLHGVA